MGLNDTAKNLALDALDEGISTGIKFLSLHTDIVGSGSGGEVSGGSPAYARKSATWGASASGTKSLTNSPVFDVPGSTTIKRVGFWDASTGGNYLGDADITDETYGGQGTYTVTSGSISITG